MINIENFEAGHYESGYAYKFFVPNMINDEWEWHDPVITQLLERAAIRLGELNSFSRFVPNLDLYIQLHVTKEAVVSSRIEGTQTRMDEALLPESEIKPERKDDWKEVNNYIVAINHAIGSLEKLPISSRLIKSTHKLLLDSVRGEHKLPGEFRTSQNWIGGNSLMDAKFIPPHHDYLNILMGDLENFLNNPDLSLPTLMKIAIAHYQFETIHPFLDGNGRIGRLLIPLYIQSKGMLDKSCLYISDYIERNKDFYYDMLTRVRTQNDMIGWIKFFLEAIIETSKIAKEKFRKVVELTKEMDEAIMDLSVKPENAKKVLDVLYDEPAINRKKICELTGIKEGTVKNIINSLLEKDIIIETTGYSRNQIFKFQKYTDLFLK